MASSLAWIARIGPAMLLVALSACWGAPSGEGAEATAGGAQPAVRAVAVASGERPPRRPTRRYYLARSRERCVIYSVDGDAISTSTEVPCPQDLARGERLRIAGKTCTRESPADPAREVPVVCPDSLTALENNDIAAARAAHADAGP